MVGLGLDSLVSLVPKSLCINMLLPQSCFHPWQMEKEALLPVMLWAHLFLQHLSPNSPFPWEEEGNEQRESIGKRCQLESPVQARYRCSSVRIQLYHMLLLIAPTYEPIWSCSQHSLGHWVIIYSHIGLSSPKQHYKLLITYLLPYLCLSALLGNRHTRHSHEVDW